MSSLVFLARTSLFLGAAALIALLFAHFALVDIFHGEGDLRLEWMVLQAAGIVVFASIGVSIATAVVAKRRI